MSDLVRELNHAIGALRAMRDYLQEESKLLVDASIPGLPTVMSKDNFFATIKQAEIAADKAVCHLSGYPWIEKKT